MVTADYSSISLRVRVRCDDDALFRRLDELFACCRVGDAGRFDLELDIGFDAESHAYEVRANGESQCTTNVRADVLDWCAWLVNSRATETAPDLVLHTAAAAHDNRGVLLAARSGAGKSTLVTALTLAGMAYMGDDSVAVDSASARIRSNPKPIAVDDHSRHALAQVAPANAELRTQSRLLAPRAIGLTLEAGTPVAPALIVQPVFRAGVETTMTPLTPADAAELLADQSFNFPARGADGLHTIATLVRGTTAFVLEFGDLNEAVEVIRHELDGPAPPAHLVEPPRPDARGELEVEILAGEALVWNGRTAELHHLSATATAIWQAQERSDDARTIADRAAEALGVPPEAVLEHLDQFIDDLVERGLVGVRR